MGAQPTSGKCWPQNRWGLIGYLLLAAGVIIALIGLWENDQTNNKQDRQLCANQHAIIEMQRLFLAEHAAIRLELEQAGFPTRHADPDLLERLARLIDAADCNPEDLQGG